MKVDKSSWHYKLALQNKRHHVFVPTSLCKYFWCVIIELLKNVSVIAGLALIAVMICTLLVVPIVAFFIDDTAGFMEEYGPFVFGGVIVYIFSLGWGACFLIKKAFKELKSLKPGSYHKKKVDKEPGIVSQYIRAKKEKVCPFIEFVDKEK